MTKIIHNVILQLCIQHLQKTIQQNSCTIILTYNYDRTKRRVGSHNHKTTYTYDTNYPKSRTGVSPVTTTYAYDYTRQPSRITDTLTPNPNNNTTFQATHIFKKEQTEATETQICNYDTTYAYIQNNSYGYRYYSAVLGRWLNRDPIVEPGFIVANKYLNKILFAAQPTDIQSFVNTFVALGYSNAKIVSLLLVVFSESELAFLSYTQPKLWGVIVDESGAHNLYNFCWNSPLNVVDPFGDMPQWLRDLLDFFYNRAKEHCPAGDLASAAECAPPLATLAAIQQARLAWQAVDPASDEAVELWEAYQDLLRRAQRHTDDCAKAKCPCPPKIPPQGDEPPAIPPRN